MIELLFHNDTPFSVTSSKKHSLLRNKKFRFDAVVEERVVLVLCSKSGWENGLCVCPC